MLPKESKLVKKTVIVVDVKTTFFLIAYILMNVSIIKDFSYLNSCSDYMVRSS